MPDGFYVLGLVVVGILCLVIAISARRVREAERGPERLRVPGYCVHCDYHLADHDRGFCRLDTPNGSKLPVGTYFKDQRPRGEHVKAVLDRTGDDVQRVVTWEWSGIVLIRAMNKRLAREVS